MRKIILFVVLIASFHSVTFSQSKVTAEKVGDKIEIRISGNLFTSYILSEFEKYPFFYPSFDCQLVRTAAEVAQDQVEAV